MLQFGLPMMAGYELSAVILNVGDRYVIQGLAGGTALGVYAAAYNLCQYIETILTYPLSQAAVPIYTRMWEHEGPEATRRLLNETLRFYVMLALPIVGGLVAVGPALLSLVASESYAGGSVVIPYVITGMMFDGAVAIVGAGLFIQKRVRLTMAIVLGSAALNVALNLLLVPRFGILGAGFATVISNATLSISMAMAGAATLRLEIPWGTLARAAAASLVMWMAVSAVPPARGLSSILLRVALGVVVYGVGLLALDARLRAQLRRMAA
jgi:O-antigen/teichoic acid export membrane protein